MSLQALLGVVRHLVVERIGVDVNYEVVRHLFGLLGSGWVELAGVVPEFLRTLVFARPRGDDQFADCTFSPSLDMSR